LDGYSKMQNSKCKICGKIVSFLLVLVGTVFSVPKVKIKDLVEIGGVRPNQLIGYGLVVGLDGTGDSKGTFFTAQSVVNLLAHFGIAVDKEKMKVKNIAAVLVTAELPPFAKCGAKIDVTVSSIGDCKDLQGGILLQTPLLGADGVVYAVAQGPVSAGGFAAAGGRMAHPTVCRIADGAIVEREIADLLFGESISLYLKEPSFITSANIASSINERFGEIAKSCDPSSVSVQIPEEFSKKPVEFVAEIESLYVRPESVAVVVVNERTGTIVMGEDIRVSACAISHGNLSITVLEEKPERRRARVRRESVMYLKEGVSVKDIVASLNAIGATPSDVIAILQALKEAGALFADIVIM
jgi:flagellar P-ring protein precursor FlgI